ncbi:MAG: hypothetical protein GY758_29585, partial [Fuerstiella sp.]|nr:hypothetical protein [Fuerstiella sp.]
ILHTCEFPQGNTWAKRITKEAIRVLSAEDEVGAIGGTSWKSFGGDQEWKKVAKESQKDGRFLRERPESIYMKATDYSTVQ